MTLKRKTRLEEMTWPEVSDSVSWSKGIILIPVGSCEQHGPYLPLYSDTIGLMGTVITAAEEAEVVVAPPIPWGNSLQHMKYPGTITLSLSTLSALLFDISESLIAHGFKRLVFINGHGGNQPAIEQVAEELCYREAASVFVVKYWELDGIQPPVGSPVIDGHAGSKETSVLLFLDPENVDVDRFSKPSEYSISIPNPYFSIGPSVGGPEKAIVLYRRTDRCSKDGNFGDPTLASKELGQKIVAEGAKMLANFLKALKNDLL